MRNIIVKSLSLSLLQEKGLSYFSIFDIRSTQAFLSAHLQGSFHAKDENDIIEYLRSKNISKPLLIVCFSSKKSKTLAKNIIQNPNFISLYPLNTIYYLDCGIMEAFENGFEPISSPQNSKNKCSFIQSTLEELKLNFLPQSALGSLPLAVVRILLVRCNLSMKCSSLCNQIKGGRLMPLLQIRL